MTPRRSDRLARAMNVGLVVFAVLVAAGFAFGAYPL